MKIFRSKLSLVLASIALVQVVGCDGGKKEEAETEKKREVETPAETPSPAKPDDGSASTDLNDHMKDHFAKAEEVRQAVIAGQLDQVAEPAKWLGEHDMSETLPEDWLPHIATFQAAGRSAASAADLNAAAKAVGDLGQACATCHSKVGGPVVEPKDPPGEASGAKAHMARHQWAVEEMWRGLMAPNDEVWVLGSEALAEAPLGEEEISPDASQPEEVEKLAKQVHALGAKAHATGDKLERAAIYGELLGTCAACHTAARKGPAPAE